MAAKNVFAFGMASFSGVLLSCLRRILILQNRIERFHVSTCTSVSQGWISGNPVFLFCRFRSTSVHRVAKWTRGYTVTFYSDVHISLNQRIKDDMWRPKHIYRTIYITIQETQAINNPSVSWPILWTSRLTSRDFNSQRFEQNSCVVSTQDIFIYIYIFRYIAAWTIIKELLDV